MIEYPSPEDVQAIVRQAAQLKLPSRVLRFPTPSSRGWNLKGSGERLARSAAVDLEQWRREHPDRLV